MTDGSVRVVRNTRNDFGDLTTSLGVVVENTGIFIDNGTGIQNVVQFFTDSKVTRVYGLQTHFHGDHRNGIQNNTMLFRKDYVKAIYAPRLNGGKTFKELVAEDFDPATWPLSPETFGVNLNIIQFEAGDTLDLDGIVVKTLLINHPGGFKPGKAVAYRICLPDGDIVVATDCELSDENDRKLYAEFISGAKLVYADVQYRDSEYAGVRSIGGGMKMERKGWGHSTPTMFAEMLKLVEKMPKKILVGHHDIARTDEDLYLFQGELIEALAVFDCDVNLAKECDCITVK